MNGIDLTAVMLQREIEDARRRFRLHIIWASVCAVTAVVSLTAGLIWGAVEVLK